MFKLESVQLNYIKDCHRSELVSLQVGKHKIGRGLPAANELSQKVVFV